MAQICEITRKRIPLAANLKEGAAGQKLLKRQIEVKEINAKVRLKVSDEGLQILKQSGGLGQFVVKLPEEKRKQSAKLQSIYDRLPEKMKPKAPVAESEEGTEVAGEAAASEAPAAEA